MSDGVYNLILMNLFCSNCDNWYGDLVFDRTTTETLSADEFAQIVKTNKVKGLCPTCRQRIIIHTKRTEFDIK